MTRLLSQWGSYNVNLTARGPTGPQLLGFANSGLSMYERCVQLRLCYDYREGVGGWGVGWVSRWVDRLGNSSPPVWKTGPKAREGWDGQLLPEGIGGGDWLGGWVNPFGSS